MARSRWIKAVMASMVSGGLALGQPAVPSTPRGAGRSHRSHHHRQRARQAGAEVPCRQMVGRSPGPQGPGGRVPR